MTGKQIRSWAWNRAGEGRGLLIAVTITGLAAGLPLTIAKRLLTTASWPVRELVPIPFFLLRTLMQMGVIFVMLRAAQGQEVRYGQIAAPFRREWWKKALLLAAAYLVATALAQLGPNLLAIKAQERMSASGYFPIPGWTPTAQEDLAELAIYQKGQRLLGLSRGLGVLLGLVVTGVWFPMEYMLFLNPEKRAGQIFREGISLGLRSLGRILVFHLWLVLPFLLPVFLVLLANEAASGWGPFLLILWLGVLVWATPYISLAQAGLALNLLGKRPKGTGKKKGT